MKFIPRGAVSLLRVDFYLLSNDKQSNWVRIASTTSKDDERLRTGLLLLPCMDTLSNWKRPESTNVRTKLSVLIHSVKLRHGCEFR